MMAERIDNFTIQIFYPLLKCGDTVRSTCISALFITVQGVFQDCNI